MHKFEWTPEWTPVQIDTYDELLPRYAYCLDKFKEENDLTFQYAGAGKFYFKYPEDALLFRLRWS